MELVTVLLNNDLLPLSWSEDYEVRRQRCRLECPIPRGNRVYGEGRSGDTTTGGQLTGLRDMKAKSGRDGVVTLGTEAPLPLFGRGRLDLWRICYQ